MNTLSTLRICLFSLTFLLCFACSNTNKAVSDNGTSIEKVDKKKTKKSTKGQDSRYANAQSLVDVFRMVSGVRVLGNGASADVQVIGISTSGNPLIVINGVATTASFTELNGVIAPAEIKRIKVLRNPTELSMYGLRGAAGVIEITLKSKTND
ncbi:MAG: TonB-dependent receptor plug domain-containing protein [Bacteroidota bacterium]